MYIFFTQIACSHVSYHIETIIDTDHISECTLRALLWDTNGTTSPGNQNECLLVSCLLAPRSSWVAYFLSEDDVSRTNEPPSSSIASLPQRALSTRAHTLTALSHHTHRSSLSVMYSQYLEFARLRPRNSQFTFLLSSNKQYNWSNT